MGIDVSDAETPRKSSGPINGAGVRILLVEDLPMSQEVASTILRGAGHIVDIANDGVEAVAAMQVNSYDLILMDIEMPRMDGFTAARRIRDLPGPAGQTPIVAMTATAIPENIRAFHQAGMDGYVAKPFQQEELLFAASDASRRGTRSLMGAGRSKTKRWRSLCSALDRSAGWPAKWRARSAAKAPFWPDE